MLKEKRKEEEQTTKTSGGFCVGVDLGQVNDYTAIAVLEMIEDRSFTGWREVHRARHPDDNEEDPAERIAAYEPATNGTYVTSSESP